MFGIYGFLLIDFCLNYLDILFHFSYIVFKEIEDRRWGAGFFYFYSFFVIFRFIKIKFFNDFFFLVYNEVKLILIVINN